MSVVTSSTGSPARPADADGDRAERVDALTQRAGSTWASLVNAATAASPSIGSAVRDRSRRATDTATASSSSSSSGGSRPPAPRA